MTTKEISYNQFIALLENNNVESVVFNNNKIEITPKDNNGNIIKVKYWTTELNDPELIQELKEKYTQVKFKGEQQSSSSNFLLILLEWVLPFVMFYVLLTFIMKKAGGGAGGGSGGGGSGSGSGSGGGSGGGGGGGAGGAGGGSGGGGGGGSGGGSGGARQARSV
jgi:ATP-dependent Zn protease